MKLDRTTKGTVQVGDLLRFREGDEYIVTNILPCGNTGLLFTIQSTRTKQTIYGYPSSQLYGAEIIKEGR